MKTLGGTGSTAGTDHTTIGNVNVDDYTENHTHHHTTLNITGVTGTGTGLSSSPTSLDNRPEYYTLAFIIKIDF